MTPERKGRRSPRSRGQKKIPLAFLRPNPRNPRKAFDDQDLEDLVASIREKGIIQPILARTIAGLADIYEIIAGERRWRAAQRAGLHDAPVILVEADDRQALELAIVENVQRADLNALEEALGYQQLEKEYNYTQADLARVIGKSRSHVTNTLRLLKLPEKTKQLLAEGKLSAGHARALLTRADADEIAARIVAQGLSVRDVEKLAQKEPAQTKHKRAAEEKDADTRALGERSERGARACCRHRPSWRSRRIAHPLQESRTARRCRAQIEAVGADEPIHDASLAR